MEGISPRRAFELRELGHELLALALRGGILEGVEAGRVGDSQRLHLGGRRDAVLDALPDGLHAFADGVGRREHTGDLRLRALCRRLASLAHLLDRLERLVA
jgi:hypothetical protein